MLDDPQTVWVVKSCCLAVFAIAVKNGIPEGSRRYLFSVKAGEAMFSTAPDCEGVLRQLLAVSIEEAELYRVPKEIFISSQVLQRSHSYILHQCLNDADKDEAMVLIEGWIERLGAALSNITTKAIPQQPESFNYFLLAPGQIFQPQQDDVSWVRIHQGSAKWMGFEQLLLTPASGIF